MVYSSETIYSQDLVFLTIFAGIYLMCFGATSCLDGLVALSKVQLRPFPGSHGGDFEGPRVQGSWKLESGEIWELRTQLLICLCHSEDLKPIHPGISNSCLHWSSLVLLSLGRNEDLVLDIFGCNCIVRCLGTCRLRTWEGDHFAGWEVAKCKVGSSGWQVNEWV